MQSRTANTIARVVLRATILLFFFPVAGPALAQGAGPYEISWYTIDGGGVRSSGGPYTLTGTIGQPDAA